MSCENCKEEEFEFIMINKCEYDSLKKNSDKLAKLEAYGVDNWSGYSDAMIDSEGYFEEETELGENVEDLGDKLDEAIDLLNDALHLLNNIHGYDTETYRNICNFLSGKDEE
jgi:hypothetical protein